MSVAQAIQDILSQDVVDSNPATVVTQNSAYGWTLDTIPEYAYKSLGSLWLFPGASVDQLLNVIHWEFGEGKEEAQGEITIYTFPVESVNFPGPLFSNEVGAESCGMEIAFRQPDGEMSTTRMEQVELRVRYLLDYLWRTQRKSSSSWLYSVADPSLNPYVLCRWDRYKTHPSSVECSVMYELAYQRQVPT